MYKIYLGVKITLKHIDKAIQEEIYVLCLPQARVHINNLVSSFEDTFRTVGESPTERVQNGMRIKRSQLQEENRHTTHII